MENKLYQMNKLVKYSISIIILALLDQATKTYFISYLKTQPHFVLEITRFLDFVYAWNYGVSFGLFKNYYQYSNYVLLALNSLITLYLGNVLLKSSSYIASIGLVFIIGGAIGNIIDRIIRGAVFDFIYFNYHNYDFPVFNLADSFISIGAAFFVYNYLFVEKTSCSKHES